MSHGPCSPGDRLWLAADTRCAAVDEDIVFLEVRRGRYFCLPGAAGALQPDASGSFRVTSPDVANELLAAGLLTWDGSMAAPPSICVPAPRESALRNAYPPPAWSDFPGAVAALAGAARGYWRRPFRDIVAAVRPPRLKPECDAATRAAVDRFHRWVPYAPVSGKCLLRSFMLRRQLEREGLSAAWVFGVATWPFLAHCWLQQGDVVLDDEVERVVKYTPILVV